jgi:hypothetical protein
MASKASRLADPEARDIREADKKMPGSWPGERGFGAYRQRTGSPCAETKSINRP